MGRFSASNHILNSGSLTKAQFKKAFVGSMKSQGCTTATEDDAALSFTLIFSPDRKWVTVLSEEYQSGGQETRADASLFAKSLGTSVVSVSLVDSDFAELELYDSSGKLADVMILGESYLGDEAPMGTEESWQPLLTGGTWDQVTAIQNGSYTFAEDALAEFAPLIGMDGKNILLDSENVSDEDNAEVLYFKKAAEKKLTLNAAFKQVFGSSLEPLGFVKIKSKYPYYVRVIGDEIIHIVTYRTEGADHISKGAFSILGSVVTVYCNKFPDLTQDPLVYNINWLKDNFDLAFMAEGKHEDAARYMKFSYKKDDADSLLSAMRDSLDVSNKILLPVISKAVDIDSCIDYLLKIHHLTSFERGEDLLYLKTENYKEIILNDINRGYETYKKNAELGLYGYSMEEYEESYQRREFVIQRELSPIEKIRSDPELFEKYNEELKRRKAKNIEILKSYGIKI